LIAVDTAAVNAIARGFQHGTMGLRIRPAPALRRVAKVANR
jgi:hypothetical protein